MSGLVQVSIPDSGYLENEFQAQLDGAVAAGTKHRIDGGIVWRGAATAKAAAACRWIGDAPWAIGTGATPLIGEIGMIENVEHLGAELRPEPLAKLKALADGQIGVVETRIAEDIAAHVAKRSERGRNQHGIALHKASTGLERAMKSRITSIG